MLKRTKKAVSILLLVVLAAVVGFRLYLPTLILHRVNAKLESLEGYVGHVDTIGVSLWRGAFRLEGIDIEKKKSESPVTFFAAHEIDIAVEWKALLHRRIVARIEIDEPKLNYVKGPPEETPAAKPGGIPAATPGKPSEASLATKLIALSPLDIDRLTVVDGQVHYRDFKSTPAVNVALTEIEAVARNLRNTEQAGVALPADIRVKAKAFDSGELSIGLKADPLKQSPTFELKQTLRDVELTKLNDFFDAYAKVKVKKGTFGLYTEAAAKDGKFIGYAEPFFKDMVLDKGRKNPAKEAWAVVASAVKWVFSNKRKKLVATKIPIEGTFEKTDTDYWAAAGGILKNAYIKALTPTVENLNLKDVDKVKVKDQDKGK